MTDEEFDEKVNGWFKKLEEIAVEMTDITDRHGLLMDASADKIIIAFAKEIDDTREKRGQDRIYTGMYSLCYRVHDAYRTVMR